jgi:hypothetical protein
VTDPFSDNVGVPCDDPIVIAVVPDVLPVPIFIVLFVVPVAVAMLYVDADVAAVNRLTV